MPNNPIAVTVFAAFVLLTLAITYFANRRSRGTQDFYAAGGRITPRQNGLALAGDYLSVASLLGTVAVFFTLGSDGLLYAVGAVAGWPIAMFLVGERLRNLGRFSFSDVLSYRLAEKPIRVLAAVCTLCLSGSYLIAQMVGAGTLVQLLFNIPYAQAVVMVGALMTAYVTFGGMVATTWIQIVKASFLLITAAVMVMLVFQRMGLSLDSVIGGALAARSDPQQFLQPGRLVPDAVSAASLGLAFVLGPAGLPHVLMRFFTVKDGQSARRSLSYATTIIAIFQLAVIVLGYAAAALLPEGPLAGGANMAVMHLARALGGDVLLGVAAAVAFATILAVVSGLTLAGVAAISHDLYKHVLKDGQANEASELRVSRVATVVLGASAVYLSLLFQHQNVGFLATLPLVIAASANFSMLILAMYWRGLTTRGAVAGGATGLISSVALIVLSKKVWVDVLGNAHSIFPWEYPTIFSLSAALLVAFVVSISDRSTRGEQERAAFTAQFEVSERGPGHA